MNHFHRSFEVLVLAGLIAACGSAKRVDVGDASSTAAQTDTDSSALHYGKKKLTYRVTIKNVTAANVLSPPLVVAHNDSHQLFDIGSSASPGIAQIAETGGTALLEAELASDATVIAVVKATGGPIAAGESRSIEIKLKAADVYSGARVSFASMIGRSNDSFVSFAGSLELTQLDDGIIFLPASNFDAGSEENTGNVADFGPGGHPVQNAELRISFDRGLNLRGDAPEIYGWGSTAAWVTIERVY